MGETVQLFAPRFNKSLRLESGEDRLTGEPGAVLLREVMERSGIVTWLGRGTVLRQRVRVGHDQPESLGFPSGAISDSY